MAVFKLIAHLDDDAATIDVQFTQNLYGSWTNLVTNDSISNYPKKFSDNRIDANTYIQFRVKNSFGEYSDWSDPKKPIISDAPEPNRNLCYVYGRLYNIDTQIALNSPRIRFQFVSGTPAGSTPLVRDITVEGDNYGWFIVALTPGITYKAVCVDANIQKNIVIPSAFNVKFSSL